MSQTVTFTRTQRITIEFADADHQPATKNYWTRWANHKFPDGIPAIDMMLAAKVPADNIVVKDLGTWEATTAEPDFAPVGTGGKGS